jgi:hypothetical protein
LIPLIAKLSNINRPAGGIVSGRKEKKNEKNK